MVEILYIYCLHLSWLIKKCLFLFLLAEIKEDCSGSGQPVLVDAMRFRPNLVISGAKPYVEDNWRSLQIGEAHFAVSFIEPFLESIKLPFSYIYLCIYVFIYLCTYPSIYLCIHLFICIIIYLLIHLFIHVFIYDLFI